MLIVGCVTSRRSDTSQGSSSIQRCTPSVFFAAASLRLGIASSRMRCTSGDNGRTLSKNPSTAGVWPSAFTSVLSACT